MVIRTTQSLRNNLRLLFAGFISVWSFDLLAQSLGSDDPATGVVLGVDSIAHFLPLLGLFLGTVGFTFVNYNVIVKKETYAQHRKLLILSTLLVIAAPMAHLLFNFDWKIYTLLKVLEFNLVLAGFLGLIHVGYLVVIKKEQLALQRTKLHLSLLLIFAGKTLQFLGSLTI